MKVKWSSNYTNFTLLWPDISAIGRVVLVLISILMKIPHH